MTESLVYAAALYLPWATLALCALWILYSRTWGAALRLLVALPLVYLLARLAGMVWGHPQPFALEDFAPLVPHDIDNAFPSDHTALVGVLAATAWLYTKPLGIVLALCALGVGAGRVLAGLHYPVDILASFVLAVVAVGVVHLILSRFFQR